MTTVSTLPTAPNRNDPSTFASRADAWVAAIGTWTTEVNTVAGEVNTNATNASTSASTATTQAGIATTKAAEAAASAATAVNAPGTSATSSTSNTIGVGSKTFTIQTGKAFVVGQWVTIADTAAPSTNYMLGAITAHNSGTGSITVNVESFAGSGTITSWSLGLSAVGGVSLNSTQTLTNKTISYASNTLTGVQPTLISGTSIKTINGTSVLGSGDISITAQSGALIWLSRVTASNSATVDCEWTNSSTYDEIIIRATNVVFDANGVLRCRMKLGGAYDAAANYGFSIIFNSHSSVSPGGNGVAPSSTDFIGLTSANVTFVTGDSLFLIMSIPGPASSLRKRVKWDATHAMTSSDMQEFGHGSTSSTAALTGIRFYNHLGNIASGTFDIYGVKHA